MKAAAVTGLLVVTGALLGWTGLRGRTAVPEDFPVHLAERGRFLHEVTAEGNLDAVRSTVVNVPVSSQRSYTIAWVAPDASPVREGDVIVRFERTELEKELEDGLTELETAENSLAKERAVAGADLHALEGDLEAARGELDAARQFKPMDEELFSRHELIEGQIDVELSSRRAQHAESARERRGAEASKQVDLLELERRKATRRIERAREGLAAIEVKAPHDGILLLERDWRGNVIRAGKSVWQGNELARIPDLSQMQAQVHVLEADAGGLAVDLPAEVVVEAHPDRVFAARVQRVDNLAKPRVRNVPVQYFGVTLELSETDAEIMKPGQRVRARLRLLDLDDVIAIPRQAIFERDGESVVHVLRDGRFETVTVELGPGSPGRVVVESGVEPGDRVALRDPGTRS